VKQRTDALQERGLASALAILSEQGVSGLTTRNVAQRAGASVPAVYEVFGDKAGIVRAVFFHGFRLLGEELAAAPSTADPMDALVDLADAFRRFVVTNPVLAQIMFAQPFADFAPTAEDNKAGVKVVKIFVHHTRVAIDSGQLEGDPTDIAHLLFAFVEGMASAESAQRFGTSKQSIERRWRLGLKALLDGLKPRPPVRRQPATPRRRA
jgi:AcrR family transcriptional regulator